VSKREESRDFLEKFYFLEETCETLWSCISLLCENQLDLLSVTLQEKVVCNYIKVICYIFPREALSLPGITIIKKCVKSRP